MRLPGHVCIDANTHTYTHTHAHAPIHNVGPYALYVGLGKRKGDKKRAAEFVGREHGVALLRFGFDEWHLPQSDEDVIKKAK